MIKKTICYIILIIVFNGCRKADRDNDTTAQMVSDNGLSLFLYNDMFKQVHKFALSDTSLNDGIYLSNIMDTSCIDTVRHTNVPGYFPDTITVDYGLNNGVACSDGIFRRGKLQMIFTGKYNASFQSVTITPSNYFVNNNKTEGKMTVICKGKNSSGNYSFSVNVTGGIISNDSIHQEFASSCQYEWTNGISTSDFNDDVFSITGKSNGVASRGTVYSSEITTALKDPFNCKWISGGVENIVPENLSPRVVTYSSCSSSAKVNINGKEFDIILLP